MRLVGGVELELIAKVTGGEVVSTFQELTREKLGEAGLVREKAFGTTKDHILLIEECGNSRAVTILVHGGNENTIEESKSSIYEALCAAKQFVRRSYTVSGGGSAEISCSIAIEAALDKYPRAEKFAVKAFAEALDAMTLALAEIRGLEPAETLSALKSQQIKENNASYGVGYLDDVGIKDMCEEDIIETLIGKQLQIILSVQMVKKVLKIGDLF